MKWSVVVATARVEGWASRALLAAVPLWARLLTTPAPLVSAPRCETASLCKSHWSDYPQIHIDYVNEWQAVAWTLCCLIPLILDEALRVRANGKR